MPLYEYRCNEDGSTLTLLRTMADADAAVEDPQGLGRTFSRVHSTFMVDTPAAPPSRIEAGGGCGCGHGGCGR